MLKVIIVDDEKKVCALVKKLIDWDNLNIEFIGEAYNGNKAFDLIISKLPDIVITDIKMPGLDGLELVKKAREKDLNIHFIIISGHKHFEYAYNAIRYGVDNYLLKPISKDELNKTLLKLCDNLRNDNKQKESITKIESQLAKNAIILRKQFIFDALHDNKNIKIDSINDEYQFHLASGLFQILTLKLDGIGYSENIIENISEKIKKELSEKCIDIESHIIHNKVFVLLNYLPDELKSVERSIEYAFRTISIYMELYEFYEYTLGVGIGVDDISKLKESILSALKAIKCRFVMGTRKLIYASKTQHDFFDAQNILTHEWKQKFAQKVEILELNQMTDLIKEVFNQSFEIFTKYPSCVLDLGILIYNFFMQILEKLDMQVDNKQDCINKIQEDLDNSISVVDMLNKLINHISEMTNDFILKKSKMDNLPVLLAKQYISENFNEQITLEKIAERVYLHPIYFSVLFKKETGVNFSNYLTGVRIEQAKQLINNVKYNISEVAEAVGYKDPKYFSKLFMRTVGVKPLEYRKLCQLNVEKRIVKKEW